MILGVDQGMGMIDGVRIMRARIVHTTLFLLAAGTGMAQPVYIIPDAVETRWASPENPEAARGAAAQANAGR